MPEELDERRGNLVVEKIKPKSSASLTVLIWTVLIAANCITQLNTTVRGSDFSPGGVIVGHIGLWTVGLALIAMLSFLMRGKN